MMKIDFTFDFKIVKQLKFMNTILNLVADRNLMALNCLSNFDDINLSNEMGYTPFLLACSIDEYEIAMFLFKHGADIHCKLKNSNAPLYYSIIHKNTSLIKFLIEQGADINGENFFGKNPLILAIEMDDDFLLNYFITKGANINFVNIFGEPLLHLAVRNTAIKCIKSLIDKKINLNLTNLDKNNVLHYCLINTPENEYKKTLVYDLLNSKINTYQKNIAHLDCYQLARNMANQDYANIILSYREKEGIESVLPIEDIDKEKKRKKI